MKIIFLDIDGVLNSGKFASGFDDKDCCKMVAADDFIDPVAVANLNEITDLTGAKIVLSSTWRIGKTVSQMKDIFSKHNIRGDLIDFTADNGKSRFNQISDWLDDHDGIDDFIIIDDTNVFSGIDNITSFSKLKDRHFFQTSWDDGLTSDISNKIISRMS